MFIFDTSKAIKQKTNKQTNTQSSVSAHCSLKKKLYSFNFNKWDVTWKSTYFMETMQLTFMSMCFKYPLSSCFLSCCLYDSIMPRYAPHKTQINFLSFFSGMIFHTFNAHTHSLHTASKIQTEKIKTKQSTIIHSPWYNNTCNSQ